MVYSKFPTKPAKRLVEALARITRNSSLRACVFMTLALCFHFLGYECSRAASITMLAAKDVGLGNEAIPLTIAMGSPLSGLTLYLYTKSIKKFGAKFTLRVSFAICILFMAMISSHGKTFKGLYGKVAIVAFYAFREIYVSLISSQQWAFIAGTLNKSTSGYIVTFSGVVSVASAVGGCSIEKLVSNGGVQALLFTALTALVASFTCSELAYHLSDRLLPPPATTSSTTSSTAATTTDVHTASITSTGAAMPEDQIGSQTDKSKNSILQKSDSENISNCKNKPTAVSTVVPTTATPMVVKKKGGFWSDSWNLICKHRMLQILFIEGIFHQLCGNMLNLMFHNGLRLEIADDATRAMLVGRFFATVNITSCTLQCFVLPLVLSHSTLPNVLINIPLCVLVATLYGVINPGLISVMLGFGTIKVLEYSIMHSASEMIYMPMGHEVRYLGKELIRFFGHKLGKSASSLLLSAAVSQLQPSLGVQSVWGALLTLCWGGSMYLLSSNVRDRDLQEEREMQRVEAARLAKTENPLSRRRGARSRSYDDHSVKSSSNTTATPRIPLSGHLASPLRVRQNRKAVGDTPTGVRPPRSLSLDQSANPSYGCLKSIHRLSTDEVAEIVEVVAVEMIPAEEITPNTDSQINQCSEHNHNHNNNNHNTNHGIALPLPTLVESDCLDAITDASGSPEGSITSSSPSTTTRSHGNSVDTMASLSQEYEGVDAGRVVPVSGLSSRELGISALAGVKDEEDEEEGDSDELLLRQSFSSADSAVSLASRERRESWERAQRLKEESHAQPVMLRVGSVSVSLNTLQERAERRQKEQKEKES